MIVRVSYSKEQNLGSNFDEAQHRSTQHLQYEDWGEFLVIWRRNRIELYENYVSSIAPKGSDICPHHVIVVDTLQGILHWP